MNSPTVTWKFDKVPLSRTLLAPLPKLIDRFMNRLVEHALSRRVIALILAGAYAAQGSHAADNQTAEQPWPAEHVEQFERQIRPLLAANCWSCHGEKKQEGGLRLDSREALLKGDENGPVVIVGDGSGSRLLQAVRYQGDVQMPPTGPLKPEAVAALDRWITQGLAWPKSKIAAGESWKEHWSFQPLRNPPITHNSHDLWSYTPIDRFVVDELLRHQLTPSPAADRRVLLRRVTFDLWGLPPSPEEITEFEQDASPDAWERLIDRLLSSPKYGERWSRHWLDVARYADTKGYVFFEDREFPWAYTYRDYVIESLNADLPYDRFVLEQLAADQLELDGDPKPLRALGYLTLGPRFMNNLHDILDDQIDVVTRGMMGLTVTCARCHDHKYDPISQADYYALYGIFRSSAEPLIPPQFAPLPETDEARAFTVELAKRTKPLEEFVHRKHAMLVDGCRTRVEEYLLAAREASLQPATDDFMLLADPGDINPALILRWKSYLEKVALQPHPVWTAWTRLAAIPDDQFADQVAAVCRQLHDPSATGGPVNPLVLQTVTDPLPASINEVAQRYGLLFKSIYQAWEAEQAWAGEEGRAPCSVLADASEEKVRQEMYGPETPASLPRVFGWGFLTLLPDRASQGEFQKLLKEVESWLKTGAGAPPRAMVLLDAEPFNPRIFERGNPHRPGDPVSRRFLSAFDPRQRPFTHGSGRLELAHAVISPQNPLTARVMVNRTWMHHIGAGLVRTPGDFGVRSDPPTHPELLDHLTTELVRHGWSWKWLHRRIVASAVYQQSSEDHVECLTVDPENFLLWKMNRRRLDLESTRDALMAVAAHLDDRLGGPSQPLFDGGFHPRRSVYTYLDRQDPPGLMTVFDFPSAAATNPQRDATTVSPQALYFMNGPLAETAAGFVVARLELAANGELAAKLDRLGNLLLTRPFTEPEIMVATDYLGSSPDAERWRSFVHALLMTNEFVFVD